MNPVLRRLALWACFLACASDARAGFVYTKLADNVFDIVAPRPPAIFRSTIAYTDGHTVYLYKDDALQPLVDLSHPGFNGQASEIVRNSLDVIAEDTVAFIVDRGSSTMLFVATPDGVTQPIGDTTLIHGINRQIRAVKSFSFDRTRLAVSCSLVSTNAIDDVVFIRSNGVNKVLLDRDATVPGANGRFTEGTKLSLGRNRLVLNVWSSDANQLGVMSNGVTKIIAKAQQTMPGQSSPFYDFGSVSGNRSQIAFVTLDGGIRGTAWRYFNDKLDLVAEGGMPLPDGSTLGDIYDIAFDGGNLAFVGYNRTTGQDYGVYAMIGERLWTVLDPKSSFDGRTPFRPIFGPQCISGNTVVFGMQFTDNSSALYKAELVFEGAYPTPVDLDGDADVNPTFFDPETGSWFTRHTDEEFITRHFGFPGVRPAAADYDADGVSDIAVFDPVSGNWYISASTDGFQIHQFGYYETQPIPADYDGDGRADRAVYETNTGWWYIWGSTNGFQMQQFGYGGTTPLPADFDGDGMADFAAYEPTTGIWYIMPTTDDFSARQFGYFGTTPVAADFDGDGADYVAYERETGNWYVLGEDETFSVRQFGYQGVQPVSADYDGDGMSDYGVYDRNIANWYLLRSSSGFRGGDL